MLDTHAHPQAPALTTRVRGNALLIWLGILLVCGLYAAGYARLIHLHTAVPYSDQANYIDKVYYLATEWKHPLPAKAGDEARILARMSPTFYLNVPPQMRPPLPALLPAALYGAHAHPQQIA